MYIFTIFSYKNYNNYLTLEKNFKENLEKKKNAIQFKRL